MGAFFLQIFRWAKVWAICGAIVMVIVHAAHSELWSSGEGGTIAVDLMLLAIIGAVLGGSFGALAGLGYAVITSLDSSASARVPLGIIAGAVSGFLSMRMIRVRAISAQEAPIGALVMGAVLGYFLAKSANPVRSAR